jgi:hypothetical protein
MLGRFLEMGVYYLIPSGRCPIFLLIALFGISLLRSNHRHVTCVWGGHLRYLPYSPQENRGVIIDLGLAFQCGFHTITSIYLENEQRLENYQSREYYKTILIASIN